MRKPRTRYALEGRSWFGTKVILLYFRTRLELTGAFLRLVVKGLGEMYSEQQIIQSGIVSNIVGMDEIGALDQLLPYFETKCHLLDDTAYWQILATIWIKSPANTQHLDRWIKLFSSTRRNRHKLMKKKDRQVWRNLPNYIQCYRAIMLGEDVNKAICWATNRKSAEFFQRHYQKDGGVVTKTFPKNRIIAYFDRRSENEVIVLP